MDKQSQKGTKNPRFEVAHKGRENYKNKLKESILNDANRGSRDASNASNEITSTTSNASNETTSATNTVTTPATSTNSTATTISSDTYVYGVGILAVLAIEVCVFLAYNTSQAANKEQANEKQDQPPELRHIL